MWSIGGIALRPRCGALLSADLSLTVVQGIDKASLPTGKISVGLVERGER